MFTQVASLFALATVSAAYQFTFEQLCPAYPICDNALLEAYRAQGLLAPTGPSPVPYSQYELNVAQEHRNAVSPTGLAAWHQQQLEHQQASLNHIAFGLRKKRSLPVPGSSPVAALTYNLPAQAQWYQQQLLHTQQLVNHAAIQVGAAGGKKKRSLPVPGSSPVAALTYNLPAQAQWYQQQLLHTQQLVNHAAIQVGAAGGKKKRSLPVPGSSPVAALTYNLPAQAQWYQQQLLHTQQLVNHAAIQVGAAGGKKKRSLPVPGTNPVAALTYNLPAQAQWYQQQQQHAQLQLNWVAQQRGAAWQ